ncbi:hypothetical protein ACH4TY_16875 [Streptomyces anulatus]
MAYEIGDMRDAAHEDQHGSDHPDRLAAHHSPFAEALAPRSIAWC